MASAPVNLFLDVGNYLNLDHQAYVDRVNGVALSNPSSYFTYREQVSKQIKSDAIADLYSTLYHALRHGKRKNGSTPLVGTMIAGSPDLSDATINEIAISLAKTLNSELDKVVAILCPVSSSGAAEGRLKAQGNASTYR